MCAISKKIRLPLASALLFTLSCQSSMEETETTRGKSLEQTVAAQGKPSIFPALTPIANSIDKTILLAFGEVYDEKNLQIRCLVSTDHAGLHTVDCNQGDVLDPVIKTDLTTRSKLVEYSAELCLVFKSSRDPVCLSTVSWSDWLEIHSIALAADTNRAALYWEPLADAPISPDEVTEENFVNAKLRLSSVSSANPAPRP